MGCNWLESVMLVAEECMVGEGTAELALTQNDGNVGMAIGHLTRAREFAPPGPCPCECNSGGFCGGCGHSGCGGRGGR